MICYIVCEYVLWCIWVLGTSIPTGRGLSPLPVKILTIYLEKWPKKASKFHEFCILTTNWPTCHPRVFDRRVCKDRSLFPLQRGIFCFRFYRQDNCHISVLRGELEFFTFQVKKRSNACNFCSKIARRFLKTYLKPAWNFTLE